MPPLEQFGLSATKNSPEGLFFVWREVLLFRRELAGKVGQVEAEDATNHRDDCVEREGLADAAEDFAKVFARGGENLEHQGCSWVHDEVVAKP